MTSEYKASLLKTFDLSEDEVNLIGIYQSNPSKAPIALLHYVDWQIKIWASGLLIEAIPVTLAAVITYVRFNGDNLPFNCLEFIKSIKLD